MTLMQAGADDSRAIVKARALLKKHWGYDSFRPMQEEIIASVLNGHDTLGLLPTGGGKSITFQVPALILNGLTLVVTPLISLMKDQVDNLRATGIKSLYLHSGLSRRENRLALDRCRLGKIKLVYISPEKLQSPTFVDNLRTMEIGLIVVDEAHCISQWGYDFRPSYLKIARLRDLFPSAPVMALTASATPEVADDIMDRLKFREHNLFARSFSRDNLSYIVRHADYKEGMLLKILNATTGSAIVYVRSRRRTREIAATLTAEGISADFYHAGLDPQDKNDRQNRWKAGTTRVMVATNAFGMGIDKPDVRVVVHMDLPSSLEEYYQEAGRAGRDGKPAFAVLIAANTDKALLSRRLSEAFPPKDFIKKIYELAGTFLDVPVGTGFNRVYEFNFNLFCSRFKLQPLAAHNALGLLSRAGYIDFVEEIATRSRVMVLLSKQELYDLNLDDTTDRVFQLLLRTYTGLFSDYQYINESLIAMRLGIDENTVYQSMLTLGRAHAVHYVPRNSTPYIYYPTSREATRYIQMPLDVYERQRDRMQHRIDAMKQYAFATDKCRVTTMLRYFGENPAEDCGKCDVCRARHKAAVAQCTGHGTINNLRHSILYIASQPGGHSIDHICAQIGGNRDEILKEIRLLADEERVIIDGSNILTTRQ